MMSTSDTQRLSDVWREVCQWLPPARRSLASKILRSLETKDASPPHEERALSDLIGAWQTQEPCGDKETERILDEVRLGKHG